MSLSATEAELRQFMDVSNQHERIREHFDDRYDGDGYSLEIAQVGSIESVADLTDAKTMVMVDGVESSEAAQRIEAEVLDLFAEVDLPQPDVRFVIERTEDGSSTIASADLFESSRALHGANKSE